MKLDIDRDNNVAYLALRVIAEGEVARTMPLNEDTLMLDFDQYGALLGIEFLNAHTQLGPLWDSEPETQPPTPIPPDYWESAQ